MASGMALTTSPEGIREVAPLERLRRLHDLLKSRHYPTKAELVEALEISPRQFERDLAFMRDRWGLPIAYSREHQGYFYTQPVHALPGLPVSERELWALLIADQALKQYLGTIYHEPLRLALEKIASYLGNDLSILQQLDQPLVSFRNSGTMLADASIFHQLSTAIVQRKILRMCHYSLRSQEEKWRMVEPYHLGCINGRWYLFAFDRDLGESRTFALSRIRALEVTEDSFRQNDFNLKDYLRLALGVFRGDDKFKVVLEFEPILRDFIREGVWHGEQVLEDLPKGRLRMSFPVSGIPEALSFVMRWSPHVTVMEPEELRIAVVEAARKMVARHTGDGIESPLTQA